MRKHKLTFSPVPASSMQKTRICPIESVFWPPSAARGCRCPPTGAKGDRTPYGFLSPLDSPYLPFKLRLPAVAQRNARGPQGRLVLQGTILDRSGAFRSDGANALHRMAAHCYARRLTQGKFRAVKRPKICPTHGTELPYLRLAEHLRCDGSKEGQGSQEGTGNHVWCPVPFCPPPWARRLRRRRRQCSRPPRA